MQKPFTVDFYKRLPKTKDKPVLSIVVMAESALHAHDVARHSAQAKGLGATHTVANRVKEADDA